MSEPEPVVPAAAAKSGGAAESRAAEPSVPVARIEPGGLSAARGWRTRIWLLTGACLIVALTLIVSSFRTQGRAIVVQFRDGFGLKAGDALRYRGIDVGIVQRVALSPQLDHVDVRIQLHPDSTGIAVEGSQFWIERPRLRLGQMSGLETVLGAKFVGVVPGPTGAPAQTEFAGLETPLISADQEATDVRVRFPAGEGLEVGDSVRYLGIAVGEITGVELNADLGQVWITCRLIGSARELARSGTQFWIERPRMEVGEIRGLETILGGRYLALEPFSASGEPQVEFVGLKEAPPLRRREGSLELELEAPSRMGLVRGAPVSYRGLEVGRVADVGLASDGASVEVQVIIEPEFADLVRDNSRFWSTGGVRFDAGLTGIELSVDSFAAWLRGGVSFATPSNPGGKVATGQHFVLAERAKPEWLAWQPRIATGLGNSVAEGQHVWPRVVRVAAAWETSWFGIARRQSAQSWGVPVAGGQLLVPTAMLRNAAASKKPVTLEVAGKRLDWDPATLVGQSGVSRLSLPPGVELPLWPAEAIVDWPWNEKSTLLIINPELAEPLPLDSSRVQQHQPRGLTLLKDVAIPATLAGSPVLDSVSGGLLGLLVFEESRWQVIGIDQPGGEVETPVVPETP
jgi:paraquat-inducible protein B